MLLPPLERVDLEGTGEEVVVEVIMVGIPLRVVGTAAFLQRVTASCPAMESSVRRTILCQLKY